MTVHIGFAFSSRTPLRPLFVEQHPCTQCHLPTLHSDTTLVPEGRILCFRSRSVAALTCDFPCSTGFIFTSASGITVAVTLTMTAPHLCLQAFARWPFIPHLKHTMSLSSFPLSRTLDFTDLRPATLSFVNVMLLSLFATCIANGLKLLGSPWQLATHLRMFHLRWRNIFSALLPLPGASLNYWEAPIISKLNLTLGRRLHSSYCQPLFLLYCSEPCYLILINAGIPAL